MADEITAPEYSGRVLTEYPTGPDLANIYLHTTGDGTTTLRIECGTGAIKTLLVLNKVQAVNLKKCLYNGLERWEGRAP